MRISLDAKYAKLPADMKTASELSMFLIQRSMDARYLQGMPRTESRMYARLLEQFYEGKAEVELDESTFNLVRETLDQSALPPNLSAWKWALLDHLEAQDDDYEAPERIPLKAAK